MVVLGMKKFKLNSLGTRRAKRVDSLVSASLPIVQSLLQLRNISDPLSPKRRDAILFGHCCDFVL